jgi:anti-sigma regulatory factor (Ser/Thr protein kinase)
MSSHTISGEPRLESGGLPASAFSHQALLYAGADEFLAGTVPFVRAALERTEPILVAVTQSRARALKAELADAAAYVEFADMEQLGRNPARIIPAWQRFVDAHAGPTQPVRGIGEPIWKGRSPAELGECHRHEVLLNLAFADAPTWQLLCPYDSSMLDDEELHRACHTHPYLCEPGSALRESEDYQPPHEAPAPFDGELAEPESAASEMRFDRERLAIVRQLVAGQAFAAGISSERASDLVLAVDELAANSVRYGGGHGTLRIWRSGGALVCEVRDRGRIFDPLVGRRDPSPSQLDGRGLWLANQLCDLVQIRSDHSRTVVRVSMHPRVSAAA